MPVFRLETNVPKSKVTPELLKQLSKAVAKTLGKPESVSINTGVYRPTWKSVFVSATLQNTVY